MSTIATNKPPKSQRMPPPAPAIDEAAEARVEKLLAEPRPDALQEAERIVSVTFLHPELVAGKSSVSITAKSCLSIEPVVMLHGGHFAPPSNGLPSSGLLIRLRVSQDAAPREYVARKFIPWANIGLVDFGL